MIEGEVQAALEPVMLEIQDKVRDFEDRSWNTDYQIQISITIQEARLLKLVYDKANRMVQSLKK